MAVPEAHAFRQNSCAMATATRMSAPRLWMRKLQAKPWS